jgi:hypothetical protein
MDALSGRHKTYLASEFRDTSSILKKKKTLSVLTVPPIQALCQNYHRLSAIEDKEGAILLCARAWIGQLKR